MANTMVLRGHCDAPQKRPSDPGTHWGTSGSAPSRPRSSTLASASAEAAPRSTPRWNRRAAVLRGRRAAGHAGFRTSGLAGEAHQLDRRALDAVRADEAGRHNEVDAAAAGE